MLCIKINKLQTQLNPINLAFKKAKSQHRPALLTYTVAGDSSKKQSLEILKSISHHADILEVGVPHNTPVADGGQIQTSAYRAIKNGIKMNDIFKIIRDYKKSKNPKPVIFMGYYNMIYQYGENNISSFKSTDGLVVGSQICKEITRCLNNRQNPVINVSKMVSRLRKKIS